MMHTEDGPRPCACGRSATGFCTGLHRLTDEEWDRHVMLGHVYPGEMTAIDLRPVSIESKAKCGSIEGTIIKCSLPDLDYNSAQSIDIQISQNRMILAEQRIDDIDGSGKPFKLDFQFPSADQAIVLTFFNFRNSDQFNQDNAIEIKDLRLDELFTVPRITYLGTMHCEDTIVENTNCLFKTGRLVYSFHLPIIQLVMA